ncbi:hypothetical protein AN478_01365 [Thiohalorhabdus denitrificans]|uniref:Uncharacterized protein n=1 Tax=Thiohalorhabdus denitrificans TaxID=381306 RepID=A0A0P9CQX6_9GAMM|nr:hypothetical protein [Thiohalorhabdus denitrificans]KPV41743.1 hypothetical protein AN478_01365 [Thiohalorhabdus denitrificans]SCY53615.1 hypothetical protein SAMN05661077_2395 [Thiohalorhabdus denitrificans]
MEARLDPRKVQQSMAFDPDQVADFRRRWSVLMELAVWGDLKAGEIGALPKLRKRMLEYGEKIRSLFNDRSWIPQPRDQIKSVLTASLDVRDKLQAVEKETEALTGGADLERFNAEFDRLRADLVALMEHHEALWKDLLNRLYDGYEAWQASQGQEPSGD